MNIRSGSLGRGNQNRKNDIHSLIPLNHANNILINEGVLHYSQEIETDPVFQSFKATAKMLGLKDCQMHTVANFASFSVEMKSLINTDQGELVKLRQEKLLKDACHCRDLIFIFVRIRNAYSIKFR